MTPLTRRQLLKHTGQTTLALGLSQALTGCADLWPALGNWPDEATDASAQVAVTRGMDLAAMTRDALNAFGGAAAIVQPGETVFIKPNFGACGMVKYNPIAKGDSVKPEIVFAVAEECLKAGAAAVTIGEAGQVPSWNWYAIPTLDGTTTVGDEVDRLNATYDNRTRLLCLNTQSPAWDAIPSRTALGHIEVSSAATRADRVISLGVAKTHRWALSTGSLKNLFGTTSVIRYGSAFASMRVDFHNVGLHQAIADIAAALRPDFAIMDFSIGCEGNGPHVLPPWWGSSVDVSERLGSWMVLASTDPVALDATATRILGLDAEDVKHLDLAYHAGLGQLREDRIELLGATLDELRMPWQPPDLTQGFLEVIIPGIHLLTES